MREAARNWLRHLTRNRADGSPLTGSYYWVPTLDRDGRLSWEVKEFFDGWLPSSNHTYVWRHVRDHLERHWKRSLKGIGYCSLPRGRICRTRSIRLDRRFPASPVIYHGNDCPLDAPGLRLVRDKFNLPPNTPAVFDIHEQLIPGEPESLSRALGIDLKLNVPDLADFDDD